MKHSIKETIFAVILPLTGIIASSLHAQTILIDFGPTGTGNSANTASPDVNGNYWNNLNSFTIASSLSLITTTNLASGITMTVTTAFNNTGPAFDPPIITGTPALGNLNISTAISDFFFINNSTATLSFTGLDPTLLYTFSILGSRNATDIRNTNYTVTGANSGGSTLQTSGLNLGGPGINYNNSSLAVISNIIPNGSNAITLDVSSAGFGYINALQITIIPEPCPSILLLVSSIFLAIVFVRRGTRGVFKTLRL